MSDNPTEPRPVLETYDPHWKTRFNAAEAMLKILWQRADPLRDHDFAAHLTKELINAHEAQYKHIESYAAAQYGHYCLGAQPDDPPELYVPPPAHAVTPEQVRAYIAELSKARTYWRFLQFLSPAEEWETGVFARTPPQGVTPIVGEAIIETPGTDTSVRMTLVVEHHAGTTHVCAVQGPDDLVSVTNNENKVMDHIAARYLPRPGLWSRMWSRLKGEPTPRLMFYYTYTPRYHGLSQQHVWGHELRWVGWGVRQRLQSDTLQIPHATPVLRDLSLALAPAARFGMTLH